MEYSNLSALQLDALKEVSNIGAGNAATALSMMIGKKVDMSVPAVNIIKLDDIVGTSFLNSCFITVNSLTLHFTFPFI